MSEAKFLTQSAIDALLAERDGTSETGTSGAPVPYNFLRPGSLEPAMRRKLLSLQEAIAAGLNKLLSAQLRGTAEATVVGLEKVYFSELAGAIGSPNALFVFSSAGGPALLDWSQATGLALVDRMFGGQGDHGAGERPLTEIETGVLERLTDAAVAVVAEAWEDILAVSGEGLRHEPQPDEADLAPPDRRYLAAVFQLAGDGVNGNMVVGLPLEPVEARFRRSERQAQPAEAGAPFMPAPAPGLQHSHLTLTARMHPVQLTLGQMYSLKPGQIIDTGHAKDLPLEVHVNGRYLFQAAAGDVRGHVGVRIEGPANGPVPDRPDHYKRGRIL